MQLNITSVSELTTAIDLQIQYAAQQIIWICRSWRSRLHFSENNAWSKGVHSPCLLAFCKLKQSYQISMPFCETAKLATAVGFKIKITKESKKFINW